jgi:hypothetical protein
MNSVPFSINLNTLGSTLEKSAAPAVLAIKCLAVTDEKTPDEL